MTEHRNENGKLHRIGGPAVVGADGSCEWWVDGKRHSKWGKALGVDGPAVAKELREKDAEIERLRNDNNRLACLAIDNAKDTGRALMYRKILQQIADEGSGHGQALAYAALKEKE